jgi:RsmE family RNA methyltransferase
LPLLAVSVVEQVASGKAAMNLLLFQPEELVEGRYLTIAGERRARLGEVEVGDRLQVGEVRGKIGWGEVTSLSETGIGITVLALDLDPPSATIELFVALPRPQMVRRILESCGPLGVKRVVFFKTSRVEKSYLQSSELRPEQVERSVLLGLEQGVCTEPVAVRVFPRFEEFFRSEVQSSSGGLRLLADPRGEPLAALPVAAKSSAERAVLAIGPERGFSEYELERFQAEGFQRCALGERILRVDVAVSYCIAQVALLKEQWGREGQGDG